MIGRRRYVSVPPDPSRSESVGIVAACKTALCACGKIATMPAEARGHRSCCMILSESTCTPINRRHPRHPAVASVPSCQSISTSFTVRQVVGPSLTPPPSTMSAPSPPEPGCHPHYLGLCPPMRSIYILDADEGLRVAVSVRRDTIGQIHVCTLRYGNCVDPSCTYSIVSFPPAPSMMCSTTPLKRFLAHRHNVLRVARASYAFDTARSLGLTAGGWLFPGRVHDHAMIHGPMSKSSGNDRQSRYHAPDQNLRSTAAIM